MPGMNGTGPRGMGPGTGRGAGPCCGSFGRGMGARMRGGGWRSFFAWPRRRWTKEEEKEVLKEEEKELKRELEEVRKEKEELEKVSGEEE